MYRRNSSSCWPGNIVNAKFHLRQRFSQRYSEGAGVYRIQLEISRRPPHSNRPSRNRRLLPVRWVLVCADHARGCVFRSIISMVCSENPRVLKSSSKADQSFQADKQHFWIFVYSAVGNFEAKDFPEFNNTCFHQVPSYPTLCFRRIRRLTVPHENPVRRFWRM